MTGLDLTYVIFFIRCKSLSFVLSQFPRLWRIHTSMKGGKGVDIRFSWLKWSTLMNQTKINKYQQTMTTDQLTSVTALSRFQRWLIGVSDTEWVREKLGEWSKICGGLSAFALFVYFFMAPFQQRMPSLSPQFVKWRGSSITHFCFYWHSFKPRAYYTIV